MICKKGFKFDTILDPYDSQADVFHKCKIHNIVDKVLEGFNATIFAYGQTSTGKTFTMEGYQYFTDDYGRPIPELQDDENIGITPRVIKRLFALIFDKEAQDENIKYIVKCSFCQIYREDIYDLLNEEKMTKQTFKSLKLKWMGNDSYEVENLFTFDVDSETEAMELFYQGVQNKIMASHKLNKASSRSHTIFSLNIEKINTEYPDDVIRNKLQLVDLAGSERLSYVSNDKTLNKE